MTRLVVGGAMLIFIVGFAFLTYGAISEHGLDPLSGLSIVIVIVLGIGVVGALRHPPD